MLFFYLAIFCSLFFGLRVNRSGFYEDYLDRKQTDSIKGLFILMVLLRHSMMVVREAGFNPLFALDTMGYRLQNAIGQLVVVMFLFYSGYGVMESIKKKGKGYLDGFTRHRLLNTLLNFDVAILCFIVLNLLMGVSMDLKQIAWSLIGWESVGNSNWYIFVILYCYLMTWVSGEAFPRSGVKTLIMTAILILVGEVALSFLKHGQTWWYNTLLCYPAGMCLSLYKDTIARYFQKNYLLVLGSLLALFLFLHFQKWIPALRGLTYNAKSIVSAFIVVLATMKIKTGNRFLRWSGLCVFPIYIYQRLPMRAFGHWAGDAWISLNPYLFILLCAAITAGIAYCYKYWQIKLK